MVATHVVKWHIEHAQNVFQVIVGQITTTDDHVDGLELLHNHGAVDKPDLGVAYGKNAH
ncbi:hypothetical protein SDC9_147931 [bioreactor metagenome]|uniref:Uncharacterized protein n=1 Tax=bioreactor metagenome TaxID=1076179 RepID=A0A645EFB5_9ZZZZ